MPILSVLSTPPYVVLADAFETGAGDAAALQAAVNAAQQPGQGGVVLLSPRTYTLETTVVLPSGTRLLGSGASAVDAATAAPAVPGTVITRGAGSPVLFKAAGTAAAPADSLAFQSITFDGNAAAADLLEMFAVGDLRFDGCAFQNATGRYLYLWQVVGAQIVDSVFFGGGSTTVPAVAVQSGGTYGASRGVVFRGCAFNGYAGTALLVSGGGGQDFTIANCSFESLASDQPALVLNSATSINLTSVAIVSAGVRGHNILAQLSSADSIGIFGALTVQHNPAHGAAATYLQSFVSLSGGSGAIDLVLFDNDSDPRTAPSPQKAVSATSSVHSVSVRTYFYSSASSPALGYAQFLVPNQ